MLKKVLCRTKNELLTQLLFTIWAIQLPTETRTHEDVQMVFKEQRENMGEREELSRYTLRQILYRETLLKNYIFYLYFPSIYYRYCALDCKLGPISL